MAYYEQSARSVELGVPANVGGSFCEGLWPSLVSPGGRGLFGSGLPLVSSLGAWGLLFNVAYSALLWLLGLSGPIRTEAICASFVSSAL